MKNCWSHFLIRVLGILITIPFIDNSAKVLISGIRKNLRLIGDKGVYEPLKAQNRSINLCIFC